MTDRYQGDPRLYQSVDGSYLKYRDGQPEMDQGLENQAEISLLTTPGWVGNFFLPEESKIGSDFITEARKTININTLNNIRQAGESALQSSVFGTVTADITNPESYRINAVFTLTPPGETPQQLALLGSGQNWINQAKNPANERS